MENEEEKKPEGIPSPWQMHKLTVKPEPMVANINLRVDNYQKSDLPLLVWIVGYVGIVALFLVAITLASLLTGWAQAFAVLARSALITAGAIAIIENSVAKDYLQVREHYKGPKNLPKEVLQAIRNIGD